MMQRGKLSIPPATQMSSCHMYVESHVGPPGVPLHHDPIVRDGDGKGSFVCVVVTLVDGRAGVGRAADDTDRR